MDTTTRTPQQVALHIESLRERAEYAADAAHVHTVGAMNATGAPHAKDHAKIAAKLAHDARTYAKTARELAATITSSDAGRKAADATEAAQRASESAGRADTYANGHPSHREAAQARADLELIQATAAYIQARRARQQVGAITPHSDIASDDARQAYDAAREREYNAAARLAAAQRETETDPDQLTAEETENPDAPAQE